jgi:hypothetical protein
MTTTTTPRPIIVCFSPKGGVGVTTLAAALIRKSPVPVVAFDLTGTGDLAAVLEEETAYTVGSLARRAGAPGAALQALIRRRRKKLLLITATRQDRALYPEAPVGLIRAARALRPVVVDAGRRPWPGLTPVTTHLLLVVTPDVRSVHRAEAALARLREHAGRVVVVENRSTGASLCPMAWNAFPLPAGRAGLRGLLRGEYGRAVEELVEKIIPRPEPEPGTDPGDAPVGEERGIIRSAVKRLTQGG